MNLITERMIEDGLVRYLQSRVLQGQGGKVLSEVKIVSGFPDSWEQVPFPGLVIYRSSDTYDNDSALYPLIEDVEIGEGESRFLSVRFSDLMKIIFVDVNARTVDEEANLNSSFEDAMSPDIDNDGELILLINGVHVRYTFASKEEDNSSYNERRRITTYTYEVEWADVKLRTGIGARVTVLPADGEEDIVKDTVTEGE